MKAFHTSETDELLDMSCIDIVVQRGYWTRKKLKAKRYGLLLKAARRPQRRESAARVIQRFVRGYLARLYVSALGAVSLPVLCWE
jgi:hypothetical protein